jgi:ferredoxin-NADP reductase
VAPQRLRVVVARREEIATDIVLIELREPDGEELPTFTAGAHIDLHLPQGLIRSYSLVNLEAAPKRYCIAIQNDANSRGGSRWVWQSLGEGESIEISPPRNSFELVEDGNPVVLLAGGIGITPLWCMVQRLQQGSTPWRLYYAARSRERAAFHAQLAALETANPGHVVFHFDDEHQGRPIDLRWPIAGASPDAHLYCCGPAPMLAAFEILTADHDRSRVHIERFTAAEAPALEGGFTVVLARSGQTLQIQPGQSILNAIIQAGITMPFACTEGVCGECVTTVLEGEPLHRDSYLTDEERASNTLMTVCCSGSKGARLVLDL